MLGYKTVTVIINNIASGDGLGVIKWHSGWRRYCFYPSAEVVFSVGCLEEIIEYIDILMDARKLATKTD